MDDADSLARWALKAKAEAEASGSGLASYHLDDIFPEPPDVGLISDAASLVMAAADAMRGCGGEGRVGLALPLGDSDQLDTSIPDLEALQLDPREPPSIYYLSVVHWRLANDREEYRVGYPPSPLPVSIDYVCSRSQFEREQDREFSRTLWIFDLRR